MRFAATLAGSILYLLASGCGYVGDPLYPALGIPSRITDLVAVERGNRIDATFTVPPLTTEGMALKNVGTVELRAGPIAAGNSTAQWAESAALAKVPPPQNGLYRASLPLAPDWIGKDVVVGVRVANTKGRMSDWSNFQFVNVQPPLAPPTAFHLTPVLEGVRLAWSAPNETKFRIYRRAGDETAFTELSTVEKSEYTDANTEYGKTYDYYVMGLNGQIESDAVGPVSITPKDIFPPAVPTGVTASAAINTIELAWERNTEPDFKQYRVFRSAENSPFQQIADGPEAPAYSDSKVESGKHYRYQIVAVDQAGNASPPSAIVEATAP